MKKPLPFLLILLFFVSCNSLWADDVSLSELVLNPLDYNQKVVEVKGEVIGEPLKDIGGYWVNISDGKGTVGVFVKEIDWERKLVGGDYNYRGDIVLVEGLFSASCAKHGGDLDIHAHKLVVLEESKPKLHPVDVKKILLSLLLLLLVLAFLFFRG
jgi:hypothetical protein